MNAQPENRLNFLFATWEGGGSVTPALAVVSKLLDRGHRVRVLCDEALRSEVEAAGAEFRPWTRAPNRPDRTRETDLARDWEATDPLDSLWRNIDRIWCGPARAYAEDTIEELAREKSDLVVSSDMLFGVMTACEALNQPFAILGVNISLYPIAGVPPLGAGLPPAVTQADHALHGEIARKARDTFDRALPALNEARAALGLAPVAHVYDAAAPARRLLLATARAFDFAPDELPDHVAYVGPQFGSPRWAAHWTSPWPASDPRPLILVSFSTTFQNHAGVIQRVLDAAAPLPARVLATLGGSIARHELNPPANAALVDAAPHDVVMAGASVVVTHGGHGTVTRALAHRKPLLIVPHGRDQADNAIRVAARGAGLILTARANTEEFAAALHRLLNESALRDAANAFGAAIAAEARGSRVAEELETLAVQSPPRKRASACAATGQLIQAA